MALGTLQTIDKYQVLENLGKGAKSTIWKVQDTFTGQIFTLKRVTRESEHDERFLEQVVTEYEVSSKLDHPYLRKSFDLKRVRKWLKTQELLLVMEYVEGDQLRQMQDKEILETIGIFMKVAKGLAGMHELGFIHADIKPKNILVVPDDGIKIIDFGQSCTIGHRKKRIQGTPDYMAPEQKERGILDQRTDVFNFGATLYWVLTGKKFPTTMSQSSGSSGDIGSVSYRDVPKPDELNPVVPSSLSKLAMDCCHHHQKDRPENMKEVSARLEVAKHLYLRQNPQAAAPPPVPAAKPAPQEPEEPHLPTAHSEDDSDDFEKFIESIL